MNENKTNLSTVKRQPRIKTYSTGEVKILKQGHQDKSFGVQRMGKDQCGY